MKNNLFNSVSMRSPKRAKFDLSHDRKFSGKMGRLYPVLFKEVLPSDRFTHSADFLCRFMPLLAPVMHRFRVKIDYFYVPTRIIWNEYEDFFTGGEAGTANPLLPYIILKEANKAFTAPGLLPDFMGVPDMSTIDWAADTINISALPFRAYQMIFNEYYRNQNVEGKVTFGLGSGAVGDSEAEDLMALRFSAVEKDYFTSSLPFTQRGDEVLIPMEAQVTYKIPTNVWRSIPPLPPAPANGDIQNQGGVLQDSGGNPITIDNIDSIQNATTLISDLRRAERLQEFLEKNAVAGGRYKEYLRAHFDQKSSDGRLQRPEYLGGGRQNVVISEVLSTATDEDATGIPPQGNMAGHGVSFGRTNFFRRRFEEHGYVIGIARVLPDTAYQQGLPRELTRFDRFDFGTPEFANIGEQELYTRELYCRPDPTTYNKLFGYQSRYSEYKYSPSTVHGQFKTTLNYWHGGQIFTSEPTLSTLFVRGQMPTRIFAVESEDDDHLLFQVINRTHAVRPLPYYGTPTL